MKQILHFGTRYLFYNLHCQWWLSYSPSYSAICIMFGFTVIVISRINCDSRLDIVIVRIGIRIYRPTLNEVAVTGVLNNLIVDMIHVNII